MALFALYALDKPDSLDVRLANRDAHLEFAKGLGDRMKLGGPLFSDDGETMIGSMIVIEANSLEEMKALAATDPYVKAGLFESVTIRPWKWVINAPSS